MIDSVPPSGHIFVIGSVSPVAYVAVVTQHLASLCDAGKAEKAMNLLTEGVIRLEDGPEYRNVRDPVIANNSEKQLAARVASNIAKLVDVVLFPYEMLHYGTQYGTRPSRLVYELRSEQQRLGLQQATSYAARADGTVLRYV